MKRKYIFFSLGAITPLWVLATSFTRFVFLDHTQRHTTVGRTPLDEYSTRRKDLYLTTHNTHNRQTPTISAGERTQTYALDRAVTGTGETEIYPLEILFLCVIIHFYLTSNMIIGKTAILLTSLPSACITATRSLASTIKIENITPGYHSNIYWSHLLVSQTSHTLLILKVTHHVLRVLSLIFIYHCTVVYFITVLAWRQSTTIFRDALSYPNNIRTALICQES
jgi:hypothetical protein